MVECGAKIVRCTAVYNSQAHSTMVWPVVEYGEACDSRVLPKIHLITHLPDSAWFLPEST